MLKKSKNSDELKTHREMYIAHCAKCGGLELPAGIHYTAGWNDASEILDAVVSLCQESDAAAVKRADEIERLKTELEAVKRALIIEGIASRNCEHAALLKKSQAREAKLKRMLNDAANNGGWISIFDELPSDGQQVLVWEDLTLHGTCRSFKGCVLYYWRDGIGWVANAGDDDAYPMICITHWKPLPEPPAIKQEKESNEQHSQ